MYIGLVASIGCPINGPFITRFLTSSIISTPNHELVDFNYEYLLTIGAQTYKVLQFLSFLSNWTLFCFCYLCYLSIFAIRTALRSLPQWTSISIVVILTVLCSLIFTESIGWEHIVDNAACSTSMCTLDLMRANCACHRTLMLMSVGSLQR